MEDELEDGAVDLEAPVEEQKESVEEQQQKALEEIKRQQEEINATQKAAFKTFGSFFLVQLQRSDSVMYRVLVSSGQDGEGATPSTDQLIAVLENIIRRLHWQEETAYQQHMMQEMMNQQSEAAKANALREKITKL